MNLRAVTAFFLCLWATSALSQAVLGGANIPTQPQRPPTQSIGGESNWYIDWTSGNVFGPKTQGQWPQLPITTLTSNSIPGIDPTGVLDSAPAISAALAVPAVSATPLVPGTGFVTGQIVQLNSATNPGLSCSAYPTFTVTAPSGAITSLALNDPGRCSNTTPVPTPPSSSPTPTGYLITGGTGINAQLSVTWAPANLRIQLPCGTFLLKESVGALHDNTDFSGSGNCTVLKSSPTIANNPNDGGLYASGANANLLSNADFVNGNSNIRVHNLKFDSSATPSAAFAFFFVKSSYIRTDHNTYIGFPAVGAGANFVQSNNFSVEDSTFDFFNGSIGIWQGSTNWWVLNNTLNGHGTSFFPMEFNGLGSNAAGFKPVAPTTSNGVIYGNYVTNFTQGINLLGLCQLDQFVCGNVSNVIVSQNTIDTIINGQGVVFGGGDSIKVIDNKISNIGAQCVFEGGNGLPGQVTSNSEISRNICVNANQSATGVAGIQINATNAIVSNPTIEDNQVFGGAYSYAVSVSSASNQAAASATIASSAGVNVVGQVLTAVGGVLASGITASDFLITAVDGSGNVTSVTPRYLSSYSTVPANPVTMTSSGAGTVTLNITWTPLGATNIMFRPGIEDTGTIAAETIAGTLAPYTAYGAWTFLKNATFTGNAVGATFANPNTIGYSQLAMLSAGGTHHYQLGVGGASETIQGVAQCAYMLDQNGTLVRWRVCSDGRFNINPINGTAAVATLDVNGTGRVAPGTFAAAGTCNGANEGKFAAINDSTTNTWGATITGSGANHVKGYCDGTNWTVYAK